MVVALTVRVETVANANAAKDGFQRRRTSILLSPNEDEGRSILLSIGSAR